MKELLLKDETWLNDQFKPKLVRRVDTSCKTSPTINSVMQPVAECEGMNTHVHFEIHTEFGEKAFFED